jgi:hypothetical protein
MLNKTKIYDENGQLTKAGNELDGVLSEELKQVIEKYADGYSRIEFEHLIINNLHFQLAFHFLRNHE